MNDILKSLPFGHKLWAVRGLAREVLFRMPRHEPKLEYVADDLDDQEVNTLEAIFILNVEDGGRKGADKWEGKCGNDTVIIHFTPIGEYLQKQPFAGQGLAANMGNDAVLLTADSSFLPAATPVRRHNDKSVDGDALTDIAPWATTGREEAAAIDVNGIPPEELLNGDN